MKLSVLEKKKDKLRVEVDGESHTLLNLLRENSWKSGANQAAYRIEHPYLSKPEIIVSATNPKRILSDSAQLIINDTKTFEREFKKALKR